ncbi:serpin family protein [Sorangium sp. So ce302]|uniref:serpin family protein n=1 Tax=Sorangium sp. So ce302 TaxID=3133297 RepID=UPI003F5FA48D
MRYHQISSILIPLSVLLAGCSSDPGPEPFPSGCSDPDTPGCVVSSEKQRILAPSVSDADHEALADGNTAFALDLYARLGSGPGRNVFYSPYSVSSALAMTYAGARTETAAEMASALHFTLPQERLHPAFNALDLALESRGEVADGQDGEGFRLNIANALWGQAGHPFLPSFLDVLAENYGAGINLVDFARSNEAREMINGWVAERTWGRIKDLVPEGAVSASTQLVLTNTIYFNAAWKFPFKEGATDIADFTLVDGSPISVSMMTGTAEVRYGEGDGYAAVEMPYDGDELSMVLVLPSDIEAFDEGLDSARLDGVLGSLEPRNVTIELPIFRVESTFDLIPPLKDMGMTAAFGDADFSGIDGQGGLFISGVVHKAFVSVDEVGTEAAAATAVILDESGPPEPAAIRFDRPFFFFIRDNATSAILFVGRVADPSA